MKKILSILILVFIVFIIYYFNINKKIKYLYIGNTAYNKYNEIIKEYYNCNNYIEYIRDDDYRTMDLLNDIKNNAMVNSNRIQNLLVKSNIIVINTGLYDIEYKSNIDYKYSDELVSDIEKVLLLIRKYNKDKIYLLGFYSKNEYYRYINNQIKNICDINNIIYIDIEEPIYKQLY